MPADWICCQLGAREHYAVPRALHSQMALGQLVTDAWVQPRSPVGWLRQSLRERFHPALAGAPVKAWTLGLLAFELMARARKFSGWPLIVARNQWFQKRVVEKLKAEMLKAEILTGQMLKAEMLKAEMGQQPILFSYSYTALEPFRLAKAKGWRTVLGQIDGGIGEEKLVVALDRHTDGAVDALSTAPPGYWQDWREECSLADVIVVNSQWSRELLAREGIAESKVEVIPLAYEPPAEAAAFERDYPSAFTPARPLRVLFLGQVGRRKGAREILQAAALLEDQPVEFWLVGPRLLDVPPEVRARASIRCFGPVPRGQVADWYRRADVFLFPTHSDGFGLTQLEAQAWRLPVITTRFCGEVVESGRNGLILERVDGPAIADAVRSLVRQPARLAELSGGSRVESRFSLAAVAQGLLGAARVL